MREIGNGRTTGIYTGLGVSYQFANAVIHSLASHPKASKHPKGGIMLPIDDKTWQAVFEKEFPNKEPVARTGKPTQDLRTYCGYYRRGDHRLGYDMGERFDFGEGNRGANGKGKDVKQFDPNLAARPGHSAHLQPMEVIELAKRLWDTLQPTGNRRGNSSPHGRTDSRAENGYDIEPPLRKAAKEIESEDFFERQTDEDERVNRPILIRRGQADFRVRLLDAYGGRCAITGCNAIAALEAAHIVPYSELRMYRITHGLLLRADIHTLFDLNLVAIDPTTQTVALAAVLKGTSYQELDGRPLLEPTRKESRPDGVALGKRWDQFKRTNHMQ